MKLKQNGDIVVAVSCLSVAKEREGKTRGRIHVSSIVFCSANSRLHAAGVDLLAFGRTLQFIDSRTQGGVGGRGWMGGLEDCRAICAFAFIVRLRPYARARVRNFLCLTCDEEEFKLSICNALIWAV